jgi:hypothetical protein
MAKVEPGISVHMRHDSGLMALVALLFPCTVALPGCMCPEPLAIVLPGSLENPLPRCTNRAEGRHERAVLESQDHNVWVRLVEEVAEGRKPVIFHP